MFVITKNSPALSAKKGNETLNGQGKYGLNKMCGQRQNKPRNIGVGYTLKMMMMTMIGIGQRVVETLVSTVV